MIRRLATVVPLLVLAPAAIVAATLAAPLLLVAGAVALVGRLVRPAPARPVVWVASPRGLRHVAGDAAVLAAYEAELAGLGLQYEQLADLYLIPGEGL